MARILRQTVQEEGILAEIFLTKEETRELGGEMDNITLFTEEKARLPARISLRGKNEATKYFLIPKQLRRTLNLRGSVCCQRIRKDNKDIFVYVVLNDSEKKSYLSTLSTEI